MNLENQQTDTIKYVKDYLFAKKGQYLGYSTTGDAKDTLMGVYIKDLTKNKTYALHKTAKAKYHQLSFSESGEQFAFIADTDTTKVQIRPNQLFVWKKGQTTARMVLENNAAPNNLVVSSYGDVHFSKDESTLYFGLAPKPFIKDTLLLKEEKPEVEVWTYDEPRLYTVQEIQLKNDSIKSFKTAFNLKDNRVTPIANATYSNTLLGAKGNSNLALVSNDEPYRLESQWTAMRFYDYKVVNTKTGNTVNAITKMPRISLSPKGTYGFGYHRPDSTWFTYQLQTGKYTSLTKDAVFYNEENDYPNYPWAYGAAGWSDDDKSLLLYDRYDIYSVNPVTGKKEKLTNGRPSKTIYRVLDLDTEEEGLNLKKAPAVKHLQ